MNSFHIFNCEYSPGGSCTCVRCRVCSRSRQGVQWVISDSKKFGKSWHWFSSHSLPDCQGLGWELDCVCTSKGLCEHHCCGLKAELCQMTGEAAWHKQDVCLVSAKTVRQDCNTYEQIWIKSILLQSLWPLVIKKRLEEILKRKKEKGRKERENVTRSIRFFSSVFWMSYGLNY